MKLENKVALITGGYKGIGRGIVDVFLKYGAKVIVLDLDESVKDLNNDNVLAINVDIREKDAIKNAIEEGINKFKKLDIIVNNAGICKLDSFLNMSDELRNFHFDININGTWNVTKEGLKYLSSGSAIVNLSSVTGPMVADPGEVAYATSKAAVLGFTKSLAAELASKNIRVNAIMPGYVHTPLVDSMAVDSNPDNPNSVIEGIANAIPLKRLANPKEIGELAAFLASDEASYITGQGIVIDGGSTLPETTTMGV